VRYQQYYGHGTVSVAEALGEKEDEDRNVTYSRVLRDASRYLGFVTSTRFRCWRNEPR
jgi:hypothetical protein